MSETKIKFNVESPSVMLVDVRDDEGKRKLFGAFDNVIILRLAAQKTIECNSEGVEIDIERPLGSVQGEEISPDKYSNIPTKFYNLNCVVKRRERGEIIRQAFNIAISNAIEAIHGIIEKGETSVFFISTTDVSDLALYEYSPENIALDTTNILNSVWGLLFNDRENMPSLIVGVDSEEYFDSLDIFYSVDIDEDKKKKKKKKGKKKGKK